MKTLQTIIVLSSLMMMACAAEELPQNVDQKILGTINGQQVGVSALWSDSAGQDNQWRVTVTGSTGVQNEWLRVNVDLDLAELFAAPAGQAHRISGETQFQLADLSLEYFKAADQSTSIRRVWAEAGCTDCITSPNVSQQLSGSVFLNIREPNRLAGKLTLAVTGNIPGWWGSDNVQASFELAFDVAVAYVPVAPKDEQPPVETPVVEETPEDNPTVGDPEGSTTKKDPPTSSFPSSGKYNEITLTAETGADFLAGQQVTKANFANSDLYATSGHQWLKLTTGGPNPVIGQPIRWFNNSSGYIKTFNNMDEMPDELPTEIDASKSLVKAKPGIGFIIKNNLSNSYTRCWIRAAGPDFVTIEYDVFTL
ncbi:MAG TPA: hypothetical protein EYN66_11430 [Myxococcales bacterium]|nr:hypothetical protein [Myxococcales bacterium]